MRHNGYKTAQFVVQHERRNPQAISRFHAPTAIAEDLEESAERRRNKAAGFSNDATRNNNATDELDTLATLFRNGDTDEDVLAEYADLFAGDNESVGSYTAHEANGIVTNSVGFGGTTQRRKTSCSP